MRTPVCFLVAAAVLSMALPAKADPGDPAGWFVNLDRRGRAFLTWTARKDGPPILMLACLRDAELFTGDVGGRRHCDEWKRAQLLLFDDRANFSVDGEVTLLSALRPIGLYRRSRRGSRQDARIGRPPPAGSPG